MLRLSRLTKKRQGGRRQLGGLQARDLGVDAAPRQRNTYMTRTGKVKGENSGGKHAKGDQGNMEDRQVEERGDAEA